MGKVSPYNRMSLYKGMSETEQNSSRKSSIAADTIDDMIQALSIHENRKSYGASIIWDCNEPKESCLLAETAKTIDIVRTEHTDFSIRDQGLKSMQNKLSPDGKLSVLQSCSATHPALMNTFPTPPPGPEEGSVVGSSQVSQIVNNWPAALDSFADLERRSDGYTLFEKATKKALVRSKSRHVVASLPDNFVQSAKYFEARHRLNLPNHYPSVKEPDEACRLRCSKQPYIVPTDTGAAIDAQRPHCIVQNVEHPSPRQPARSKLPDSSPAPALPGAPRCSRTASCRSLYGLAALVAQRSANMAVPRVARGDTTGKPLASLLTSGRAASDHRMAGRESAHNDSDRPGLGVKTGASRTRRQPPPPGPSLTRQLQQIARIEALAGSGPVPSDAVDEALDNADDSEAKPGTAAPRHAPLTRLSLSRQLEEIARIEARAGRPGQQVSAPTFGREAPTMPGGASESSTAARAARDAAAPAPAATAASKAPAKPGPAGSARATTAARDEHAAPSAVADSEAPRSGGGARAGGSGRGRVLRVSFSGSALACCSHAELRPPRAGGPMALFRRIRKSCGIGRASSGAEGPVTGGRLRGGGGCLAAAMCAVRRGILGAGPAAGEPSDVERGL